MTPTISNADLLKHKALTVRLFRKKFNKNKGDRALAEKLHISEKVTDKSALRVNKSLFPNSVTKPYQDIITKAGKYFYRMTLPWDDKGFRLLPIELYKEFTKEMKAFTRDFREQVNLFVTGFESNMLVMKESLGNAYSDDDYSEWLLPDGAINTEAIKAKFLLETEFGTVNTADDLRASLTEEDREVIAQHITAQNNKKFAKSQEHVITLLHDKIMALRDRLGEDGRLDEGSPVISNLEDLCDLIPKLNFTGDPELNKTAEDAKAMLCKWSPATLRELPKVKQSVSDEADKMLDDMKGMI